MKQILYTVAKNKDGLLLNAKNAKKGDLFFCLMCNNNLILRKSISAKRRPHFAHKTLTPNCTPETVLHEAFKILLADKINLHIKNNIDFKMGWDCENCYYNYREENKHEISLTQNIKEAKIEHSLGPYRADIALLNFNDRAVAVIEIVVTHHPENSTVKYYKDQNINLIKFELKGDEDLEKINNDILYADFCDFCLKPICKKCNSYVFKKNLLIEKTNCWKCKNSMTTASFEIEGTFGQIPLCESDSSQIKHALSRDVFLTKKKSGTNGSFYLANTCRNCKNFIGGFYIERMSYDQPMKILEIIDDGYFCEKCGDIKDVYKSDSF